VRDRPDVVLTRHFFTSLFDFGFLSDDGADSAKRALLGSLAVAIAFGLLLTRVFMAKYASLAAGSADAYEMEVVADHAFLMAVPMWVVASACGLVGHSLFPDQTDFRVLMAEPLSRSTIFGSKLASLLLFGGLFVAGTHLALLPLMALTMIGAVKFGSILTVAPAFAFSSLIGSLFAGLAIVAVHGLLILLAPRARLLAFSGAVRSLLIGVLVLSLPLVARLPGTAKAFSSNAWWLPYTPPAWFVGLERWLAGDARYATLAALAAIATAAVVIASVVSYAVLYRRFDRVIAPSAPSYSRGDDVRSLGRWIGRSPVRHAVHRFVSLTVRRSVLHQTLVVGVLAAAGGFVLNSLLSADGWREPLNTRVRGGGGLFGTLLWAPMTMIFLAIPAIRIALSVPLDLRSNWIFRMTEDVPGRGEVVAATVRIVLALAVALPLAILGPVQWWMLGRSALNVVLVEAAIGWLLVEWLMADWRRIPFTCSYIPGKGFVPHMVVKGFASYLFFTLATGVVLRFSQARLRTALLFVVVLGAAAAALSMQRWRHARTTSLTFEEAVSSDVTPLGLNAD
jgi:hypothetical protein